MLLIIVGSSNRRSTPYSMVSASRFNVPALFDLLCTVAPSSARFALFFFKLCNNGKNDVVWRCRFQRVLRDISPVVENISMRSQLKENSMHAKSLLIQALSQQLFQRWQCHC